MNFFATITLMLQSVLSMLGFAQQSPNLPPETQTQIVQTAREAIQTATTQINKQSSGAVVAQVPSDCSKYASLKRGDTDATTGGLVSQLQQFLGIAPATGTYGALTGIGYNNICIGGNTQPASVAGMSKYTDSDFGFSFWYPSSWHVFKDKSGSGSFSPWQIEITAPSSDNSVTFSILELDQDSVPGSADNGGRTYFFDSSSGTWEFRAWNQAAHAADVSNNTMGGLHIFENSIIPLSARTFITVQTNLTGQGYDQKYLISTILATDPTVAIPVSTAQQTATIQAEANAYGVQSSQNASMQTYTNSQYGFSVQSDPTLFTTTKPQTMPFMGYPNASNALLALYYTGNKNILGFGGATLVIAASNTVTYEDCIRMLGGSQDIQGNTKQVIINGQTFYKDTAGDAATGHYSSTDSYRTYYNGACYEATSQIDTDRVEASVGTSIGDTTPVLNDLQATLNSLKFTMPDTAPVVHAVASAQWSTFLGHATPVSFQYPGSFTTYESESESDVGPGTKAGLETFQSNVAAGAISVQMTPSKYFPSGDSAQQAMLANMKREAIGYPSTSYTNMTLGGEQAYTRSQTSGSPVIVIYVAHNAAYYRILLWETLLSQEYQTFVNSFRFTN